jgi:diazepam-binding inhibitor (GABA receptor modulating acyl-CoA-binding protein)
MDSYPLVKHFDEVKEKIKEHGKTMTNDDLQIIYGLYKQATVGDINIEQPSFYQLTEKAKWNAWNSNKGKSSDLAKQEYVEHCLKFFPDTEKQKYSS